MAHDPGASGSGQVTTVGATPISTVPQPGWVTLNDARELAFTGEIVFETTPEVRTYLDNGVVYFAERATAGPIGERLLDLGLLDRAQLERGIVRVGDVDHLGRLFDRDPSVERDAILVLTESETEVLIAELANEAITTVRATAYRHHPSGIHRWFVEHIEAESSTRPGHRRSPFESGMTDEVSGLPIISDRALADQLYIEWNDPIVGGGKVGGGSGRVGDEPRPLYDFDDSLLQAILDDAEFADVIASDLLASDLLANDLLAEAEKLDMAPGATGLAAHDGADEFQVRWPDGDAETTTEAVPSDRSNPLPDDVGLTTDDLSVGPIKEPADAAPDELVAHVSEGVADSVRRAIAALESATAEPASIASIAQPDPVFYPDAYSAAVLAAPAAIASSPSWGFAPPSVDTSVEAIYARAIAATEGVTVDGHDNEDSAYTHDSDDTATESTSDDLGDRSSALKRLIGSLRRK